MKKVVSKVRRLMPLVLSKKLPGEFWVVQITEGKSQELNRMFRRKNCPTNVLSFLYGKDYGEILVCPEVIRREAKEQRNTYKYQMTWMILHGMLHLAGMHHERSRSAAGRVEKLEEKILSKIFK